MIHDRSLLDRLSQIRPERFQGEAFRATGKSVNPIAPSLNGGRWALPPGGDVGAFVLYTSLQKEGALAEVCSFLAQLTPIPKARNLKVARLAVTASHVARLTWQQMSALGIDAERYGERDYGRTQEIGAAFAFLEFDGLIVPSARWNCDNLVLFTGNHALSETLEVRDIEEVEWRQWAQQNSIISG